MATRGRGRPKGSKNKAKTKPTASKTTTGRRGRPKGSKNRINTTVDHGVNQLVSKTEEMASSNGEKLVQGKSLVEVKVVEVEETEKETEEESHLGASRAEHTHSSYHSTFKSYIVDREGYTLDKFAKSLKGGDYFSGGILVRAMCDYEQRLNFYLTHCSTKNKKAFKEAIYDDIEILKQRIESM